MNEKLDLARITQNLIELKGDLARLEADTRDSRSAVELDQSRQGRLTRMDALQGQAMAEAVARRRRQALQRIEAALERMEDGEFGYCVTCGDPIDVRRLELDPAAPRCARCASDCVDKD
ncbi:MAG: TraR/DksA family transcriptional regulator [Rhodothalassiaceae bacterium]